MLKEKKKIYLASDLGFSEAGREFLYLTFIPIILGADYEIIDPWKLTSPEEIKKVEKMPPGEDRIRAYRSLNHKIGNRNYKGILKSDGLIAILNGAVIDDGVAAEVGFASAKEKRILGYRGDFRPVGENEGAIVNIQLEYFIHRTDGRIAESLEEFKRVIKSYF